jgi:GTP-binding protein Era
MSIDLLFDEELPPDHRSGFVTIAGRPNVGKSTLLNYLLGQKLAIVSPKPQTTRNQLLGILTLPTKTFPDLLGQVIFVDTPGIHTPHHKLGEYLLETAQNALPEADVIIWLADVTRLPGPEESLVVDSIRAARDKAAELPVILALNKLDMLPPDQMVLDETAASFLQLFPDVTEQLFISATRGDNCDELLRLVVSHLPPGPRFFPEEQVTDQHIRFLVAELIREAALTALREEVPHALAVVVTEFKPRHENLTYISANLVLERKSQKQIVIGEKGKTLKKIGRLARTEIEVLVDTRVYLDLWVKVRPGWRKKKKELKWLGYSVSD